MFSILEFIGNINRVNVATFLTCFYGTKNLFCKASYVCMLLIIMEKTTALLQERNSNMMNFDQRVLIYYLDSKIMVEWVFVTIKSNRKLCIK